MFEKPHWRAVFTTTERQKAPDLAKVIDDEVRIEAMTPEMERLVASALPVKTIA